MTAKTQNLGRSVAYFSMEIALTPNLPTYSGGLGVLAGDTLKAAADMGLPVVAVSLLYRQGYFKQHLDAHGKQSETPVAWTPDELLERQAPTATISIEGKPVTLRAYQYTIVGAKGHKVPVYFLDTDIDGNDAYHRTLSGQLYGGDERYRLCQEALLGIGGVAMLTALGLKPDVFHMNEGHAALLTLALGADGKARAGTPLARPTEAAWKSVKERCVFTTHTPVPAGHDTFPIELAKSVLGAEITSFAQEIEACPNGRLNMSDVAIQGSRYVNGVAKRHAEVSRRMFPGVHIDAITNGVHAVSWTADAMQALFDKHLAGWREDNNYLRFGAELPLDDLRAARRASKAALFQHIEKTTGQKFDPDVFTIGFARRAAEYKRADLLFHSPDRLRQIAAKQPIQIVYGGKAHPRDFGGKRVIENVFAGAKALAGANIKIVYLENYDMTLGRLICSGVDLWLNNPVKPLEASGTSGMKAAINGIPSLSTLDGWWVEGNLEDQVGWELPDDADAFGGAKDDGKDRQATAARLYDLLERRIMDMYYGDPVAYARIARNAIYLNGPYFNTHRMVLQYFVQAYTPRV